MVAHGRAAGASEALECLGSSLRSASGHIDTTRGSRYDGAVFPSACFTVQPLAPHYLVLRTNTHSKKIQFFPLSSRHGTNFPLLFFFFWVKGISQFEGSGTVAGFLGRLYTAPPAPPSCLHRLRSFVCIVAWQFGSPLPLLRIALGKAAASVVRHTGPAEGWLVSCLIFLLDSLLI